jgi:hypothetical protein
MVNELHFTFVHNVGGRVNTPAISIADYGSAFVMQGAPALPLIDVSGYFELDTPIAGTRAGGNTYQIRDVLSLERGKHSLRFGGSFFRESLAHFTTLDNYGEFEFDGDFTGDGFADFLLGLPTRIDQDAPIDKYDDSTYVSAFFQDDYRIHPRLTLNLGLRYDLQFPLTSDLSATLAYVGARGKNLPFNRNLNYPNSGPGSVDSRRPILPRTLGNIRILDTFLTNQYDGLQLTVDKRLTRNFLANAAYTFGKRLEDARLQDDTGQAVQNFNDILADRGRTDNDRRHQFKASIVWTPDYFGSGSRVAHAILDGWTVSGIIKLRSGRPLTITAGRDANSDGTNNDRANLVPGVDPTLDPGRPRSEVIGQWFNSAAFAAPPNLTDGTSPRNVVDGPGSKLVDIGVYRDLPLGGGRKLQLRMEATNALSFVNLDNPNTNIRSSNFGMITSAGAMRRIQVGARFSF